MATKKKNNQGMDAEEMLSRSETFIEKNQKKIMWTIVIIAVVIAGIVLYKNFYQAPREEKASTALSVGETYFDFGNYDMALNGDSTTFFGLNKVIEEYNGTDAANLANAYAGLALAQNGKFEEAIKYLEEFNGGNDQVSIAIKAALGNCYANVGNLEKAVSLLEAAAKESNTQALSPIWLRQAGIIYEKLGKKAEALKCYTKIKDSYYDSPIASDIDKYIEKVK